MTESAVWEKLKRLLSDTGLLHLERCDVKGVSGWPDMDYVAPGLAGKLELKHLETPAARAEGKKLDVRPDQALWLSRWTRHGGHAGVLVYVVATRRWGLLWAEPTEAWRTLACSPAAYNALEWLDRIEELPDWLRKRTR